MAEPRRLLALFYDYVPDMLDRRGPFREGHLALIDRFASDGRIVIAGAVGDPPSGGLIVFAADERDAIDAFVAEDPYVANGLVTAHRVEPWTVVTS